jgi:ATP-dependent Lon protease
VLPRDNEPNLEELPAEARKELEFVLVDSIEDVFAVAFGPTKRSRPRAAPASERQAAASV